MRPTVALHEAAVSCPVVMKLAPVTVMNLYAAVGSSPWQPGRWCEAMDVLEDKDPLDLGGSLCLVSENHTSVQWFKRANELQQLVNLFIV